MQVKDMTVEQLRDLIRDTVEQCLEESFGDRDAGLEVKEKVKQKLLESIERKQAGESSVEVEGDGEVISAEEIAESQAALADYFAGRDRGISSKKIKLKLFGEKS
ncbi:MAG: hypothetical protein JGK17_29105 [Microcoleus sp. PH2017_10_PVI_O_A]|uniref:hypothetical protein n=1 Tax=unclassified Microcoleus TaxID=2642155 RepID=UPI001D9C9E16|nr:MULTISPECIES: hypothetical protein [unclassified Microcoleus]TAE75058.1 MAG: hypothetical protein EAZ83_29660 [Oscillatoriales cyanobacterium]MCC3409540.1 hypothetical protein [Microcoleus sp. PH2017_10_PVI_O_A]MCC3463777.1 hypothetical protein [Microcoleus sp. PH2017_11_PCY_U_A]MCC3482128.1 hypothetical protein [Microcoleus sp. PH2017_12_PCY_D_A]MCC3531542.1 hypothetical protein [Microcoleus sp. PH2017_21_RUC_O_A]